MWDPRTYEDTDYGLEPGERFEPDDVFDEEEVDLKEPHVMTVLGAVFPDEVGVCLPHEHLLSDPPALASTDPDYRLDREDLAAEELEAYITLNGRTVVEWTTRDYGRNVAGLVGLAGVLPIYLVGATGRHNATLASRMDNPLDVDALTSEFIRDLTVGMDGTEARAGIIMAGTSREEITPVEQLTLDAAAAAHRATAAPVALLPESDTMALRQVGALAGGGVPTSKVIVGQLDAIQGPERLLDIARTGAYLLFDRVGQASGPSDTERAGMLLSLAEAGHASQLLVSHGLSRRSGMLAYGGGPGLAYLLERFTLMLMAAGAEALLVRALLVENPAAALTIVPPDET